MKSLVWVSAENNCYPRRVFQTVHKLDTKVPVLWVFHIYKCLLTHNILEIAREPTSLFKIKVFWPTELKFLLAPKRYTYFRVKIFLLFKF